MDERYGKLRRCTEQLRPVVDFYLFLAATLVVLRRLIQSARRRYRWPNRPTSRRLRSSLLTVALSTALATSGMPRYSGVFGAYCDGEKRAYRRQIVGSWEAHGGAPLRG